MEGLNKVLRGNPRKRSRWLVTWGVIFGGANGFRGTNSKVGAFARLGRHSKVPGTSRNGDTKRRL